MGLFSWLFGKKQNTNMEDFDGSEYYYEETDYVSDYSTKNRVDNLKGIEDEMLHNGACPEAIAQVRAYRARVERGEATTCGGDELYDCDGDNSYVDEDGCRIYPA